MFPYTKNTRALKTDTLSLVISCI